MALTLMVQPGWRDRVAATWRPFPGVVPVLKGNGYGFGRLFLAGLAVELGADEIAVGTIYEIAGLYEAGVKARPVAIVLTPCLPSDVAELGR